MRDEDEIRILLRDSHEIGEIDGAWGAGIARLASEAAHPAGARPRSLVLTEPAIASCVKAVAPGLPVRVSTASGSSAREALAAPACAAFLDLLFLRGRLPDPGRWGRIRSYGLRAAILGCALAEEFCIPHTTMLADPFDEHLNDPRSWRIAAWIRHLEARVVACADVIEAPDEECARKLREVLLIGGAERIRVEEAVGRGMRPTPVDAVSPLHIAVEASTRSQVANRTVLRAIRDWVRVPDHGRGLAQRLRIHWLASRSGREATRARQDMRRWDLARFLCWDEAPWIHPPHLRAERWTVLIRADPRSGARPLHSVARAAGARIVVPSGTWSDNRTGHGDRVVDWNASSLRGALETLTSGGRRPERRGVGVGCEEERR